MTTARRVGGVLLAAIATAAIAAPALTPHTPSQYFTDYENAPPMRPHVFHADGRIGRPYVYRIKLVDRLERRYEVDLQNPAVLQWFRHGTVA